MLKKLDTLRFGRGVAALSVLLYHVEVTLSKDKYFGHSVISFFNSGYSGVHYFFVLSGFLMAMLHHHHLGRPEFAVSFLRARFMRIYPPLWMTLLVVIFVYAFFPSLKGVVDGVGAYFLSFLALPISTAEPFLAVEWTLRYEIIFYFLVFLLILNKSLGFFVVSLFVLGGLFSLFFGGYYVGPLGGYVRYFISEYFLLFFFGAVGYYLYSLGFLFKYYRLIIALGLIAFLFGWIYGIRNPSSPWLNIYFGGSASIFLVGFAFFENKEKFSPPNFFLFLGDASYSVYLIHFLFVSAACKLVVHFPVFRFSDYFYFGFVASCSLIAGLAFYWFCERKILSLVRKYSLP